MAPSATQTETVTLPDRTTESLVKLTGGVGPYKELAPIGYEKKAEEEGPNAAKVRFLLSILSVHSHNTHLVQALPASLGT